MEESGTVELETEIPLELADDGAAEADAEPDRDNDCELEDSGAD